MRPIVFLFFDFFLIICSVGFIYIEVFTRII